MYVCIISIYNNTILFLKKANYDIFPLTVIKQFYNTEDRGGEQQKSN